MRGRIPYERYQKLFDRALELELVHEDQRHVPSVIWEKQDAHNQNFIVDHMEKEILAKEKYLEEREKRYDKTFIIDFDHVESGINAVWVPPGYRFIQLYYGGCDTYAVDHDGKEISPDTPPDEYDEGDAYCDAARDLAEDEIEGDYLQRWREAYPDVDINPETDIVLSCDTSWDKRTARLYVPSGVKATWTDKSLIAEGEEKIDAARFLYSEDKT